MRVVAGLFCVIMLVFALVQYNDPDFLFWSITYSLGAIWCALVALKPRSLAQSGTLKLLFAVCLIAAIVGTVYYWPVNTAWWHKEVIWDNELVREGLGMAIVTFSLVIAGLTWWLQARRDSSLR